MRTLGGIELPGQIQWTDRYEGALVAQETFRTIDGGLVVWAQGFQSGREITLEAGEDTAWFTLAQVIAIQTMAAAPGATYPLEWDGETHTVIFRHHDHPATTFAPLWPEFDRFTGTIKLLTV